MSKSDATQGVYLVAARLANTVRIDISRVSTESNKVAALPVTAVSAYEAVRKFDRKIRDDPQSSKVRKLPESQVRWGFATVIELSKEELEKLILVARPEGETETEVYSGP